MDLLCYGHLLLLVEECFPLVVIHSKEGSDYQSKILRWPEARSMACMHVFFELLFPNCYVVVACMWFLANFYILGTRPI